MKYGFILLVLYFFPYCNYFTYEYLYLFVTKDDAVFRRKIAESANIDERNRLSENKRGRWDKPDVQINNSEDHWERIVERARNQRRLIFSSLK